MSVKITESGIPNFGQCEAGLYRCGQPSIAGLQMLITKYGMQTRINLHSEDGDLEERQFLMQQGFHLEETPEQIAESPNVSLHYIPLPFPGFKTASPEDFDRVLSLVQNPAYYPLVFGCRRGSDRTGTIKACKDLLDGVDLATAMKEADDFGMSVLEIEMRAAIVGFAYRQFLIK